MPSCDSLAVPLEAAPTEAGGCGEHSGEEECGDARFSSPSCGVTRLFPPHLIPSDLRNGSCRRSLRLSSLGLALDGQWCGNRQRSGFCGLFPSRLCWEPPHTVALDVRNLRLPLTRESGGSFSTAGFCQSETGSQEADTVGK